MRLFAPFTALSSAGAGAGAFVVEVYKDVYMKEKERETGRERLGRR
jgi:hypothetical protein